MPATTVEDAHLLPLERLEVGGSACGYEPSVIGNHTGADAELVRVVHHQRNIADSVVLAFPRGSDIGYCLGAVVVDGKPRGLCQVVVVLLLHVVPEGAVLFLELRCQTVAVADNGCWPQLAVGGAVAVVVDNLLQRAVAGYQRRCRVQQRQRRFAVGEVAGSENDSVESAVLGDNLVHGRWVVSLFTASALIIRCHLKYPATAMTV